MSNYYRNACNDQCMRNGTCDDCPLDFTPRRSTARVPIFCQSCRKQGKVVCLKGDDPRIAKQGGRYSGPTMSLVAYLAGAPKVCQACDTRMMESIDTLFDE